MKFTGKFDVTGEKIYLGYVLDWNGLHYEVIYNQERMIYELKILNSSMAGNSWSMDRMEELGMKIIKRPALKRGKNAKDIK